LKPFVETDEEFWDRVLEVNFKGALRLTHGVLPGMLERGWAGYVTGQTPSVSGGLTMA
jgi:2-hydroxycyclohexanecarboxyl-CoA dehydrogenase